MKNKDIVYDEVREKLKFLEDAEIEDIVKVIGELDVDNYKKRHKVIINYENKIKSERKEEKARNYYNPYYDAKSFVETGFFAKFSESQKDRGKKILSCLYFSIEKLGGEVNEDFSVRIRDEIINLEMEELKSQVIHELTKREAKELLEYQEKKKRQQWAYPPSIRKYDHVFNGKLKIIINNRNQIKETEITKLEDRLGDIIIKLYEKSEQIKIERMEREAQEKRRREEARKREEKRKRVELEAEKIQELVNISEDYRIACEIRSYISALSLKDDLDDDTKKWIEWANKKADWFDPIIAMEDEVLGKRKHNEGVDKKFDKITPYYGWY